MNFEVADMAGDDREVHGGEGRCEKIITMVQTMGGETLGKVRREWERDEDRFKYTHLRPLGIAVEVRSSGIHKARACQSLRKRRLSEISGSIGRQRGSCVSTSWATGYRGLFHDTEAHERALFWEIASRLGTQSSLSHRLNCRCHQIQMRKRFPGLG